MRPEVHAAALRSAAKLVLGMASFASFTVACSASSEESGSNSEAVTTNNDSDGGAAATGDDDDDSTASDAGLSSACEAKLNATFPGADRYQSTPVKEPKAVVECCNEALENDGFIAGHRWACCVSYDKVDAHGDPITVAAQLHGNNAACSPWGPPVPPRMKRVRKASSSRARRDMNIAVIAHLGLVA